MATKQESLLTRMPEPVPSDALTPAELLRLAVSRDADVDKLQKLMDLQERWQANEARKAFVAAMKRFKDNPPLISKNKTVTFKQNSGGQTSYKHATLDHVCDVTSKALSAVGITHAWKVSQDGEVITVFCVLTHELGHSETTQLMGLADNSGTKNKIQAIGSTVTYLQRYTLLAACGLAATNDDDGANGGPQIEAAELEQNLKEISEAKSAEALKFLFAASYGKASDVGDFTAMAKYIQAKDKRKKEMANAAS